MSVISQFFPSPGGSSSGGGAGNIGGGTTPVEIIGVSGGGGGGGRYYCPTCSYNCCDIHGEGGQGGSGAIFYASNYFITPGTTYPITIGSGGSGGTPRCSSAGAATQGSNGGATSFNNPDCKLCVAGGGGGGAGSRSIDSAETSVNNGKRGGTGGSGGNWNKITDTYCCANCFGKQGTGQYFEQKLKYTSFCCSCDYAGLGGPTSVARLYASPRYVQTSEAKVLGMPWGWMGGFPAGQYVSKCYCGPQDNPACQRHGDACGGGMMSNAALICHRTMSTYWCSPCGCYMQCEIGTIVGAESRYYNFNWTEKELSLGNPCGTCSDGGSPLVAIGGNGMGAQGCPGMLVIRYPTEYGAATVSNGTDISPQTPGYRTYCFTTSGSITL